MLRRLTLTLCLSLAAALLIAVAASAHVSWYVVAPFVVIAVVLFRRGERVVETAWSGSAGIPGTVSAPSVRIPSEAGSAAAPTALARVETRQLVLSPWFGVGLGFWVVIFVVFGVFASDVEGGHAKYFMEAALFCHPFVGMTVIAAHRNRTRARRDGCEELFETCPTTARTRTLAHLATAWLPAVVCAISVAALGALIEARGPTNYGPAGAGALPAVLACAALGAGAVALGVALARFGRSTFVPVAAVVAVGVASAAINAIGGTSWATDRLLGTFVLSSSIDPIFVGGHWWPRLVWIVALVVFVGALGLIGRRARGANLVAIASALVIVLSAILVVRPISTSDTRRIAELVADPQQHESCHHAGETVRVCAYRDYDELAARVADDLRPVAAAVPAGVLDDVTFATWYHNGPEQLPAEVRHALDGRPIATPAGALRLRFELFPENRDAARLRLAAYAVGLPTETYDGSPTVIRGQARGVVALWLARRGLGTNLAHFSLGASAGDATDRGAAWPGGCAGEAGVLQWAPTDLAAADALLDADEARVAGVLQRNWARLIDPRTKTDELLRAVGLPPVGPPEPVEARPYGCT